MFKKVPNWLLTFVLYLSWDIFNAMVLWYPQLITNYMSEPVAYRIRAIIGLLLMFVILPFTYQGGIVERLFACFLIEVVSIFGTAFRYTCMVFLKTNSWYYELEKKEVLLLVFRLFIEGLPYFAIYFIFRKWFEQYHELVKKHQKGCAVAIVINISLEVISAFITLSKDFQEIWRGTAGVLFLFLVIILGIYLLRRENEQKYLQKQLLENHYQSVKCQEDQILNMQSEIGNLLDAAERIEKQKEFGEEDIKNYAAELKKIHSKLKRIDYCDNLMMDALLHNKATECEESQIKLDIHLQDINYGKIPDLSMFEIVYGLLKIAIKKAKLEEKNELRSIRISGKNMMGQVVIEITFPSVICDDRKDEKEYRRIKRKIQKCKGKCVRSTEGKTEKIIVGMPVDMAV